MNATMEPPKLRIDDGCLCTVTVDSKRFHEGLSKIVVTSCETLLRGVKLTMFLFNSPLMSSGMIIQVSQGH